MRQRSCRKIITTYSNIMIFQNCLSEDYRGAFCWEKYPFCKDKSSENSVRRYTRLDFVYRCCIVVPSLRNTCITLFNCIVVSGPYSYLWANQSSWMIHVKILKPSFSFRWRVCLQKNSVTKKNHFISSF